MLNILVDMCVIEVDMLNFGASITNVLNTNFVAYVYFCRNKL